MIDSLTHRLSADSLTDTDYPFLLYEYAQQAYTARTRNNNTTHTRKESIFSQTFSLPFIAAQPKSLTCTYSMLGLLFSYTDRVILRILNESIDQSFDTWVGTYLNDIAVKFIRPLRLPAQP